MPNQYHSDLEELRQKAKRAKIAKERERAIHSPSAVKPTDIMLVLHADEVELLEELMYDILESDLGVAKKRIALNILNHIQSE